MTPRQSFARAGYDHLGQAVTVLPTGSGTSLANENIPAMHDPTQPTFASECEIA
jgi:hypothetical protein